MSTATEQLFSTIESQDSETKAKAFPEYRKLLGSLVAGEEIDAAEARKIIDKMGKSPAEVEADVTLLRKRLAAVKDQTDLDEKWQAAKDVENQLNEHVQAKQAYLDQWKADHDAFRLKLNAVQAVAMKASQAQRFLSGNVLDPTIELEKAELDLELQQSVDSKRKVEAHINSLSSQVESIREANTNKKGELPKHLAADIEDLQEKIAQAQSRLELIAQQREDLEQRRAANASRTLLEA